MRSDLEGKGATVAGNPVRRIAISLTDWLQNRLIQALNATIEDHSAQLAAHDQRLNRITRRVRAWEARMTRLQDFLTEFRGEVNAQTNRISGQLADLQARLAAGDDAAVTEVSDALSPLIADLQAIGSGTPADPLPTPPADAGSDVPADDTGGNV
jgi:uncharacterized coiled-coil protein SlyX